MIIKDFIDRACLICNTTHFNYINDATFWQNDIDIVGTMLSINFFGSINIDTNYFDPYISPSTNRLPYRSVILEKSCNNCFCYSCSIELQNNSSKLYVSDLRSESIQVYFPPGSHPNAPEDGGRIYISNLYFKNRCEIDATDGYKAFPILDLSRLNLNNPTEVFDKLTTMMVLL
jgi:hypothetical protein